MDVDPSLWPSRGCNRVPFAPQSHSVQSSPVETIVRPSGDQAALQTASGGPFRVSKMIPGPVCGAPVYPLVPPFTTPWLRMLLVPGPAGSSSAPQTCRVPSALGETMRQCNWSCPHHWLEATFLDVCWSPFQAILGQDGQPKKSEACIVSRGVTS